ncbi:hypothetical protein [Mycoplana rhizolycopersici]|uniref:hypothetical protein n=1 Tax=Mycoplana rhizolycopersici TaxID=2746702 RepID=UPI003CCCAFA6
MATRNPVQLDQLLARQRRTEIQIAFADQIRRCIAEILAVAQTGRTILIIGLQQPVDLTSTEVEQLSRVDNLRRASRIF